MTAGDEFAGVRGTTAESVRSAIADEDPLPGTTGFAAELGDRLVTDVLGRRPVFLGRRDGHWALRDVPTDLDDWRPVPPGTALPLSVLEDPRSNPLDVAERIWSLPDPDLLSDRRSSVDRIDGALGSPAVPEECPVAFSGGVDSTVVASLTSGPLYVAGVPGSPDVRRARAAARAMGRLSDLTVLEIDERRLRTAAVHVARATGRTNAMDVSIAVPLWIAARRASEDGHDALAVGQGADELFGGYEKVERAPVDARTDATTVRGAAREMVRTIPDQFARDVPLLQAAGVAPVAPLAHDDVVRASLEIPGEYLVSKAGERKFAFRLAARRRIPDGVAFQPKAAVQYGSGVADELDEVARRAGYERSEGDHVRQFVESLLASA